MSIVRNGVVNVAAAVTPAVVSLLILPTFIHTIGQERFGMVTLMWLLLGYFGVLDFGLSAAVTQRMASAPAGDIEARREIFWTAAGLNLAFGLAGALLVVPVAYVLISYVLRIPAELLPEVLHSIWWLILALPSALLLGVMRGALQADARFMEMSLIDVTVGTLAQVAPLVVALAISPRLTVLFPAMFISRWLVLACLARVVTRGVLKSSRPTVSAARARDLLSFGGWLAISSLLNPLITAADRYLIGSFMGVRSVTHYSVPLQVAERTTILPVALVTAMFPRLANASTDDSRELCKRGMRAIAAMMSIPLVTAVIVMKPGLKLWIGEDIAQYAGVCGQILMTAFWWNALGIGAHTYLLSRGQARLATTAHLMEVLPYLATLVLCLKFFGLPGAAAACALRLSFDALLLSKFGGVGAEFLRLSGLGACAFALAHWVALPLDGGTMRDWLMGALVIAGTALVSLTWLYAERSTLLVAIGRRRAPAVAG